MDSQKMIRMSILAIMIVFALVLFAIPAMADTNCQATNNPPIGSCLSSGWCGSNPKCSYGSSNCAGLSPNCPSGFTPLCGSNTCLAQSGVRAYSSYAQCTKSYTCPADRCAPDNSYWEQVSCNGLYGNNPSTQNPCSYYKIPCLLNSPTTTCDANGNKVVTTYTRTCSSNARCGQQESKQVISCNGNGCEGGQCKGPVTPCTAAAWSCSNWQGCSWNGKELRGCNLNNYQCGNPNAVKPATERVSTLPACQSGGGSGTGLPTALTLTPSSVTIAPSAKQPFTASKPATFTVQQGGGSIDANGVYTAPSVPSKTTDSPVIIAAVSKSNPAEKATATIQIQAVPSVNITYPIAGSTITNRTPVISWSTQNAPVGAKFFIRYGTQSFIIGPSSSFPIPDTKKLDAGTNAIYIDMLDSSGSSFTPAISDYRVFNVALPVIPPTLTIISPTEGQVISAYSLRVTFNATNANGLEFRASDITDGGDPAWYSAAPTQGYLEYRFPAGVTGIRKLRFGLFKDGAPLNPPISFERTINFKLPVSIQIAGYGFINTTDPMSGQWFNWFDKPTLTRRQPYVFYQIDNLGRNKIKVAIDGGTPFDLPASEGSYSAGFWPGSTRYPSFKTPVLADGPHRVDLRAFDANGEIYPADITSASINFTVKSNEPMPGATPPKATGYTPVFTTLKDGQDVPQTSFVKYDYGPFYILQVGIDFDASKLPAASTGPRVKVVSSGAGNAPESIQLIYNWQTSQVNRQFPVYVGSVTPGQSVTLTATVTDGFNNPLPAFKPSTVTFKIGGAPVSAKTANLQKVWAESGAGWGPPYCHETWRYSGPKICDSPGNQVLTGKDCSSYQTGLVIKTAYTTGYNFKCVEQASVASAKSSDVVASKTTDPAAPKTSTKLWQASAAGWGPPYCHESSRYTGPKICNSPGNQVLTGQDCSAYQTGLVVKTAYATGYNYKCVDSSTASPTGRFFQDVSGEPNVFVQVYAWLQGLFS